MKTWNDRNEFESREQIIFNKEIISSFGCLKMKVAGTDKTAKDT